MLRSQSHQEDVVKVTESPGGCCQGHGVTRRMLSRSRSHQEDVCQGHGVTKWMFIKVTESPRGGHGRFVEVMQSSIGCLLRSWSHQEDVLEVTELPRRMIFVEVMELPSGLLQSHTGYVFKFNSHLSMLSVVTWSHLRCWSDHPPVYIVGKWTPYLDHFSRQPIPSIGEIFDVHIVSHVETPQHCVSIMVLLLLLLPLDRAGQLGLQ